MNNEKKWQMHDLYQQAHYAGMEAGKSMIPFPMVVVSGKQREVVSGGVCGFAWVNISPARGSFVQWLKENGLGHKSYYGGYDVSCREFGQSLEKKQAYCHAFASILRAAGINAFGESRMD